MGAPKLDPHLREVLQDLVESGPADGFFAKMQPEHIGGVFRAPDEPVSIARAGFSSLERHLVRFHREELALVLRKAFLTSFYTVNPKPVCQGELPDPTELVRASREAMQRATPGTFTYRSSHFLRRILRGEAITSSDDQISMLVASMRLEDHAHARHYYAMCFRSKRDFETVRTSIAPLLDSANPLAAVPALGLWRECLESMGNLGGAQETSLQAALLASQNGLDELADVERSFLCGSALLGLGPISFDELPSRVRVARHEQASASGIVRRLATRTHIKSTRLQRALEQLKVTSK